MAVGSADLQKRSLFIGIPVAVLTIAGSGWAAARIIEREFERTAESRLAATARRAAVTARLYVDERRVALSLLASAPSLVAVARAATDSSLRRGWDRLPTEPLERQLAERPPPPLDAATERFLAGYASQSDMTDLVLTDRLGIAVYALQPQPDRLRSDEPWWQEGMQVGEGLHLYRDTTGSAPPAAAFAVLVLDAQSRRPVGLLRGDVPLTTIGRLLVMDLAGVRAELVDSAGIVVASVDSLRLLRELEDADAIRRGARGQVTHVGSVRLGRQIAATAPVGVAGWWVVVREEEAVTYAAARSLQRALYTGAAVIGVIVVLMILWITYWLEQNITRPVRTAGGIAGRVAAGELAVHVDAEDAGSGEVGALLTAVGSMVLALRNLVGRIRTAAEDSAAMAQEISASTEQMSASTEEMAATCQNLTEQATEQAGMVRSAANDAKRILSISTTLADGAGVAAERNTSLLDTAEKHRERLLGGGETLAELASDLEQGLADARRLADMSEEIQTFVKQARAIATQTNMLALNAAIEASRASGGEGRGFGVVADEVRKLASQTARSAGSTSETVQSVLATLTSTVERLTRLAEASQQVRRIAEAAAGGLQEVAAGAAETSAWTGEISGAAGEVQHLVEEISKRLTTIAQATDSVVAAAEEIAASAEQQSASTEEIASSATHLAQAAQHLTEAVTSFRTG